MKSIVKTNYRLLFYTCWFVLGLLQSSATELIDDEAYYWVYSKFLSWGYFDHPPMVALLIKIGYAVFQNELGVRLMSVLLSTCTIFIVESLIEKKNFFLFASIVISVGFLQLGGILAVPDTPLLFFTALFFWIYKKYVADISYKNAFGFGLIIALLFYSKYHGLLVLVFSLLSNLRLLRYKQTWFIFLCVLFFYTPHLFWQTENDWVSFRYHLFESNVNTYKFSYTTDYILGQLLLTGPLIGFLLLPAAFFYSTQNKTEKALKFTMVGFYLFFLLNTFRGRVEPNWTAPVLISVIVLSHQFLLANTGFNKTIKWLTAVSLFIIVFVRIYLIIDIGPDNKIKSRFHHHKIWAESIVKKTKNFSVVFYNSYQRASMFWFYSGNPSHALNNYRERKNNYNFWPTETDLLGAPVFVADIYNVHRFPDSITTKKGWVGLRFDSSFSALGKIQIRLRQNIIEVNNPDSIELLYNLSVPKITVDFLKKQPALKTELVVGVFGGKILVEEIQTGITAHQLLFAQPKIFVSLKNVARGNYFLRVGIKTKNYPPTQNSEKIKLIVKK